MADLPILSLTIFLPLIGCFFVYMVRGETEIAIKNARIVALLTSLATFLLAILIYLGFDETSSGFQFVEHYNWIPSLNMSYHVGIDGISMLFILLTTFLIPISILSCWYSVKSRVKEYMMMFLLLETLLIGVFSTLDFILFYLFFEGVLIPMFLIIGIWGGERRVYSAYKFFLYTLAGSVLMLVAILSIYFEVGSTDILAAFAHGFSRDMQLWLFLAFFASFAVKIPMWPVHTWLPDAHVQAPTAGSVMLAAVLLKMGGYGYVRFSLPLFPEASLYFADMMYVLSIIAIIYTSLVALAQEDMKKLIAYSSIAHMGFVTLGTFTFDQIGVQGALFQMFSHGLISAALFLCVGVVYDREHTHEIAHFSGLAHKMPAYAFFFAVFMLGSVALPGTTGFWGELLVLLSTFHIGWYWTVLAASSMVLGASYMLWMYRRVVFGTIIHKSLETIKDLNWVEKTVLVPICAGVIFFGIYPMPIFKLTETSTANVIASYSQTSEIFAEAEKPNEESL